MASMVRPVAAAGAMRVYNVVDDLPAEREGVNRFACDLLGIAPPPAVPFEEAELTPMARSFYSDNKRCTNTRIKEELGVALRYPTYRDGLPAQLDEERQHDAGRL
jgi:hypothetical protein